MTRWRHVIAGIASATLLAGCSTIPQPVPVAGGQTSLEDRVAGLECRVTALENGDPPEVCDPTTTTTATTTAATSEPPSTTTEATPTPHTDPAPTTSQTATTTVPTTTVAPEPGGMPAIRRDGTTITRNGQPWWFVGYNSFVWSANCGHPEEKMTIQQVENWFASMRNDGHAAVRLFFFEGWNLQRLDAAVASAKRHNIYLTITLDDAIGGCGENDKDAAWFENDAETDAYERHMRMLLERYKGETAIAWFEFFNEPDNEGSRLREFFDRMGAAADEVDPSRLFASGLVAPYWVDGEANYRNIHESPGVDIASLHEYDQREVESNHGDNVRANSAGKPVIVGEFGIYSSASGSGCETDFGERAERFQAKLGVYTDTSIGYVGGFGWAWQPGNGGSNCEYGNLDGDPDTQRVIREFSR